MAEQQKLVQFFLCTGRLCCPRVGRGQHHGSCKAGVTQADYELILYCSHEVPAVTSAARCGVECAWAGVGLELALGAAALYFILCIGLA